MDYTANIVLTCCICMSVSLSTLAVASSISTTFAGDSSALKILLSVIFLCCKYFLLCTMHAMLFLTCLLQYLSVNKSFWWFFPLWKPLTKFTRSTIDDEWDLAKQSSWRCPAESDDRSKRASRPPTRLINPSNLISLSLSGICNWVCLLGFLHRLQQLSVRTESHRIEILTEGSREEERILWNDNQLFSQLLKVEHPDVDGVDVHLASGHLGQAEEAVEQGGLATPCPSNNTHLGMYNVKAFPEKLTKIYLFPSFCLETDRIECPRQVILIPFDEIIN